MLRPSVRAQQTASRQDAAAPRQGAGLRPGRHATLLLAAVPVVPIAIAVLNAIAEGWTPLFDQAIIAANALDAITVEPRLVGVYSDASIPGADPVYGAGPLFLWLIAPAARLTGDWGLPLTVGVVNGASAFATVVLADRLGGRIMCVATSLALTVMLVSLPPATVYDPINPSCALLPFTALLFIAWAVGTGEYRFLPVLVLIGSFVLQTHFSLGLAVVGCMVIALIGLVVRSRGGDSVARTSMVRWTVAALIVGVCCWAPALLDQVIHTPGNLTTLKDTASSAEKTLGDQVGWHTAVRAIGVRPWWLQRDAGAEGRLQELLQDPRLISTATSVLILAILVAALGLALYRGRADVAVPAAIALMLCLAIFVTTAATPARLTFAYEKATRWTLPAGMFVWLVVLHVAVTVAEARGVRLTFLKQPARRRTLLTGVAAIALLAAAVLSTRATVRSTKQLEHAGAASSMVNDVAGSVEPGAEVLVRADAQQAAGETFELQTAIVYRLRRQGNRVLVPPGGFALDDKLGDRYRVGGRQPDTVVTVSDRSAQGSMSDVVSRVTLKDPGATNSSPVTLTATVATL
jgi:hypothetical protein